MTQANTNLMPKGYVVKGGTIILNRELTQLDLFVKKFLDVMKRHTGYLVVSGFVSISAGRARGTEDVDIIFPQPDRATFERMLKDLEKNGFWCYQGDRPETLYPYLASLQSLRFSQKNELFPNIEFIPFNETRIAKSFEYSHPQRLRIKDFEFNIPPLEFEILYKELILKSKKDIEDARHLRTLFSAILKEENFIKFRPIILREAR